MAASKRYRAAVIGGSGYGGAELIRRLLLHPDVELVRVASVDHVGEPLGAAHPNLERRDRPRVRGPGARARRPKGWTSSCSALPHKVSAAEDARAHGDAAREVVDMSGDFRLATPRPTSGTTARRTRTPSSWSAFVYGLPELNREQIRGAAYVASPGCFATTIELALLPLARGRAARGRRPRAGHHRLVGLRRRAARPARTTRSAPATCAPTSRSSTSTSPRSPQTLAAGGRAATSRCASCRSRRRSRAASSRRASSSCPRRRREERLGALYEERVRRASRSCASRGSGCPRSSRSRARTTPRSASRSGRRAKRPAHRRAASAPLDNLIKGGAGQAIQNMNLVLGVDETRDPRGPGALAAMMNVVVKLGGEVVASPEMALIARDVRALVEGGHAGRDRPRRRAAGDRAAEAARARSRGWWRAGASPTRRRSR